MNQIISTNVLALLDSFPDSKGTRCYVQMMKSIVNSYLDKQLSPLRRIEEAWFALFFLQDTEGSGSSTARNIVWRPTIFR